MRFWSFVVAGNVIFPGSSLGRMIQGASNPFCSSFVLFEMYRVGSSVSWRLADFAGLDEADYTNPNRASKR